MWAIIWADLKALLAKVEAEMVQAGKLFGTIVNSVLTGVEHQAMIDAKPIIQQIAQQMAQTQGGLNAKDFISALMTAAIPALEAEGIKLAHTAIAIVCATVAKELGIADTTGNAGTVQS